MMFKPKNALITEKMVGIVPGRATKTIIQAKYESLFPPVVDYTHVITLHLNEWIIRIAFDSTLWTPERSKIYAYGAIIAAKWTPER